MYLFILQVSNQSGVPLYYHLSSLVVVADPNPVNHGRAHACD